MASKHWIQGAIKHPGSFSKAAKRHGMSTKQFAARVKKNPGKYSKTTRRRAALANTLRSIAARRGK